MADQAEIKNRYAHCSGWRDQPSRPEAIECPPSLEYPVPSDPVDILFVSWNPPGTTHFWNNDSDRLRIHLGWVLSELGWKTQPDFLEEFIKRRCYLVHATKCWRSRNWPSPEATARCARALLTEDINRLKPRNLCLLGSVPHFAASLIIEGLPPFVERFPYEKGWKGRVGTMNVIITVLPNQWNRQSAIEALKRWLT